MYKLQMQNNVGGGAVAWCWQQQLWCHSTTAALQMMRERDRVKVKLSHCQILRNAANVDIWMSGCILVCSGETLCRFAANHAKL